MDNEVKYCPLLSMTKGLMGCMYDRCAWYVPAQHPRDEGHCVVRDLSMLPHIAREVSKL